MHSHHHHHHHSINYCYTWDLKRSGKLRLYVPRKACHSRMWNVDYKNSIFLVCFLFQLCWDWNLKAVNLHFSFCTTPPKLRPKPSPRKRKVLAFELRSWKSYCHRCTEYYCYNNSPVWMCISNTWKCSSNNLSSQYKCSALQGCANLMF